MKACVNKTVLAKVAHVLRGDDAAQIDFEFRGWLGGHVARAVVHGAVLVYQFEACQADFFTFSCSLGELRAAVESAGRSVIIDRHKWSIGGVQVTPRCPYPHFLCPALDTAVWLDAPALLSAFAQVRAAAPGADGCSTVRFVKSPFDGTLIGLWDNARAAFTAKSAVWGQWHKGSLTHTITLPLWVFERALETFNGPGVFKVARGLEGPTEISGGRFCAITR